jgi:hypothetical protein
MKPSQELFELIKSLTKSEKRYFKLFSSIQKGDKFYLKLFDAIEKGKSYNKKKIFFDLNLKMSSGTFATAKHRLNNLLLQSMENYHSNAFTEVHRNMSRADFLYNKGLFKQSQMSFTHRY